MVCYGRVTRVEFGRIGVTTKKLPGYSSNVVMVNTRIHKPTIVTKTEFTGSQVGVWLRKSVVTLSTEDRFHGQVVGYANRPPKIVVRTRAGDLNMHPDEVSEIPGPLGLILFNTQLRSESTTVESVYEGHEAILKRIKGNFPDQQPVKTRAEIFAGLAFDPNNDAVDWINPITGSNNLCRPDHAIECMRWEDNLEDKPRDVNIGLQWCDDPSFNPRPVAPNNYVEPPRRIIHYKTKNREESISSDTIPDEEEEVKEEFEAESISSEEDNELEEKNDNYADDVDAEELSEVSSVTQRMLKKDDGIRAYANLDEAPESYLNSTTFT